MADWQAGDLALCVRRHPSYPPEVKRGRIFTVEYVWPRCVDAGNPSHIDTALDLAGIERIEGDIAYWARSFRKVTPDKADEFDREVIEAMSGNPVPVSADMLSGVRS